MLCMLPAAAPPEASHEDVAKPAMPITWTLLLSKCGLSMRELKFFTHAYGAMLHTANDTHYQDGQVHDTAMDDSGEAIKLQFMINRVLGACLKGIEERMQPERMTGDQKMQGQPCRAASAG